MPSVEINILKLSPDVRVADVEGYKKIDQYQQSAKQRTSLSLCQSTDFTLYHAGYRQYFFIGKE